MKIQITLFALGGKWGLPSGGAQSGTVAARAMPSRWSIAPSTSPVNPRPESARKVRRLIFPHELQYSRFSGSRISSSNQPLTNRHEIIMIQQSVYQVFPRARSERFRPTLGFGRPVRLFSLLELPLLLLDKFL